MNDIELLKERYAEEMWERKANGIETQSFESWKKRIEFFQNWAEAKANAEDKAEALAS